MLGREQVALQIVNLAEAAGIDPVQQEAASWGRTFSRWVWPFGEDEAASANAMFEQEFEEADETAPWWWPFWSEKAPNEPISESIVETESSQTPNLDTTVEEITVEVAVENISESPAAKETSEKNARSVRDWSWPF